MLSQANSAKKLHMRVTFAQKKSKEKNPLAKEQKK